MRNTFTASLLIDMLSLFLGDRVTGSIFLKHVTGEELFNIVHSANDNESKCYDSIDMCLLKKHVTHILTPLTHNYM